MDPVFANKLQSHIRPVIATQGLSPLLQEGRQLGGEVLERMDGGTLLLRLGEHKVPAETGVEMQPGDRFKAQVEREGDRLVLRLIPDSGARVENSLVQTVRSLIGDERPVGEVLRELASRLRAQLAAAPDDTAARAILSQVEARLSAPHAATLGQVLAAAANADPLSYALLLLASTGEAGTRPSGDGVQQLIDALKLSPTGEEIALLESAVRAALASTVPADLAQLDAGGLSRLVRAFEQVLARTLAALGAGASELHERLRARGPDVLSGREGRLLFALVLGCAGGESARRCLADAAMRSFDVGLRGHLVRFLLDAPEGPLREAASRALRALELEQVLNGARREHGEPLHLELGLPEAHGSARTDVFLRGDREGDGSGDGDSCRATVAVRFTRLGAVRADLALRDGRLAVRLAVEDPSAVAPLQGALPELVERLQTEGREVAVRVVNEPDRILDPVQESHDIAFLRESHLMDVEG